MSLDVSKVSSLNNNIESLIGLAISGFIADFRSFLRWVLSYFSLNSIYTNLSRWT